MPSNAVIDHLWSCFMAAVMVLFGESKKEILLDRDQVQTST